MLSRASRSLLLNGPKPSYQRPILAPARTLIGHMSTAAPSSSSSTPIEDSIRAKLTASLHPTHLAIANDSHLHAHHAAMQTPAYAAAVETHFRVHIVSDEFTGKMQPARHRMVYRLLVDEMQREGGVHALQLVTRTAEEEERKANEGGGTS